MMKRATLLTALLVAAAPVAAAAEDDGVSLGLIGGYADWEASTGRTDLEEGGESFGMVGRITTSLVEGAFVGVQASWTLLEGAAWQWQGRVGEACASLEGEIDWNADALALIGMRLDWANVYAGAGLALARGSMSGSMEVCGRALAVRESGAHTGYKLAAGLELPIGERIGALLQVDHADYGDDMYGHVPISLTATGLRLGVIYRF